MSDDTTKVKKSSRRAKTNSFAMKQLKIAKTLGIRCDSPHRYAKRKAANCGKPDCFMCANPRKIYNQKTVKEQQFIKNTKVDYRNDNL